MELKVWGPNLRDQSKGTFHVHEASCKDNKKPLYRGAEQDPVVELDSKLDVVTFVYPPGEFEYDETSEEELEPYINDIYFFPCTKGLPDTSDQVGPWPGHLVGSHRLQIGPGYIQETLVFSDEEQHDGSPYPTGDFTTYVTVGEIWYQLTGEEADECAGESCEKLDEISEATFGPLD